MGKRRQEFGPACRVGRAAKHMQPVPDLQILHVAEIGVEARELIVFRGGAIGAAFGEQPRSGGAVQNFGAEERGAAAVEPVGGGVFVDEPLELQRLSARACGLQRRREMSDGRGAEPAQEAFAATSYYAPTNVKAKLAPSVLALTAQSKQQQANRIPIDWSWITPRYSSWVDRIKREVISG